MKESPERGKNVKFIVQFIRHGVRDPQGNLSEIGKTVTRQLAQEHATSLGVFDVVKAVGSTARPKNTSADTARSLVTAGIYARGISDKAYTTRPEERLNYDETTQTPFPYDHTKIYNEALGNIMEKRGLRLEEFGQLSDQDKQVLSHEAQKITIDAAIGTRGDMAEKWKDEVAGAFADYLEHCINVTKYLKSGSRVLQPAGTHGGLMEWLLIRALVWEDSQKRIHQGVNTAEEFEELGGAFDSSESYQVFVETDNKKKVSRLKVRFMNPRRPQGDMYLDADKVHGLADFFRGMHKGDTRKPYKYPSSEKKG